MTAVQAVSALSLEEFFAPIAEAVGLRHSLAETLQIFALAMARWLPITSLTPFLGGRLVPAPIKIGLASVLSLALVPWLSLQAQAPLALGGLAWWALLVKEIGIGVMLGFAGGIVFWAGQMGGRFVDTARGTVIANLFVPQTRLQSSMLGDFYFQLLIVLYMMAGGHRWFLSAVYDSYRLVPPMSPTFRVAGSADAFIEATAQAFVIGVKLVAPAVVVIMMLDLVLGMANRMAPQLDVFFISLSLKSALPALAIALSLYYLGSVAMEAFSEQQAWLSRAVHQMAPPEPATP